MATAQHRRVSQGHGTNEGGTEETAKEAEPTGEEE